MVKPQLPESIEAYLDWLTAQGASSCTTRAYRTDLTQTYGNDSELNESAVAAKLTELQATLKPATICRKLAAIRSYETWRGNPTFLSQYRAPTPAKPIPHPMPGGIESVHAMLARTRKPHHRALLVLTGLCGLRISEARSVTAADVDIEHRMLRVRGKGNKQRDVPLSVAALEVLEPMVNIGWKGSFVDINDRAARAFITRCGLKATGKHVASHDMRATLLTAAFQRSKNLRAVQEIAGHASVKQTQTYTKVDEEAMREAIEV